MKNQGIGGIITYPIGLILVIGISGVCLISYIALRTFGPIGGKRPSKEKLD